MFRLRLSVTGIGNLRPAKEFHPVRGLIDLSAMIIYVTPYVSMEIDWPVTKTESKTTSNYGEYHFWSSKLIRQKVALNLELTSFQLSS